MNETTVAMIKLPTSHVQLALLVLIGMIVVIGSALGFEHIGGYAPCALCLEQRFSYYWGIPFMALGLVAALLSWPQALIRILFLIVAALLLYTAGLGVYHSGVEWGFFEAPTSCGAGFSSQSSDAGNLLESLATATPPKCDDAAGRFLGLSFAGWNFIAAAILAFLALRGALEKPGQGSSGASQ